MKLLMVQFQLFFKIKPRRPLKKFQTKVQEQASTALEESVLRSSFIVLPRSSPDGPWINKPLFFKIKPKSPRRSVHHCSSRSSPKALEDPFITIIQDQALTALEETFILKIKPQRLLEDPLKSTFKDQAHDPLKKLPTVHPRSNLNYPWINETSTNQHLTEIE
ncbi:hypothetical protein ACFX15_005593 [Malus domestica]